VSARLGADHARRAAACRRGDSMKRRLFMLATGATALGAALVVPHAFGQSAKAPRRVARERACRRPAHRDRQPLCGRSRAGFSPLAAELAALKPAVFVALGKAATDAALAAAAEVPVVSLGDLVASGHAGSLARPAVCGRHRCPTHRVTREEFPNQIIQFSTSSAFTRRKSFTLLVTTTAPMLRA
jgi:hypothetical protein